MKKFMLTTSEIDAHKLSYQEWGNFIRHKELDIIFSLHPQERYKLVLELGAGDGKQSAWIAPFCDKLICTDKNDKGLLWDRNISNVEYRNIDAQDLSSFDNESFDLIFSSNMLEHIPDIDRCLNECRRVLNADGKMFHAMPNRWWKIFYYGISLAKRQAPIIHGICKTHLDEFIYFGAKAWQKRFARNNLRIVDIVGLPFYIGHGPTFIPIIKAGNMLRMPASYLYIVKKN